MSAMDVPGRESYLRLTTTVGRADNADAVPKKEFGTPRNRAAARASATASPIVRLLVFTSLFPNGAQPRHGLFVEERLRHLLDTGRTTAKIVAPVPWFPFRHRCFGKYAVFARAPRREQRHGVAIDHPRYPVIPKVGMNIAPFLMYRALLPVLQKRLASGDAFDVIDAHYFYPDGVAAARLGLALNKPVVITARGSDVNTISRYRVPRRQIRWAADCASEIITVSRALKEKLVALGVDAGKITCLRNGIDLDEFRPLDREAVRAELRLAGAVWLAVGHLVELKGVDITLEALAQTAAATLLIAGEGPEETRLRKLVRRLGIHSRVRFLGAVPHAELCRYYNAADVMLLASSREGMPNVVLESLACGTPVIVAPFDGATELISVPEAGEVAASRTPAGIMEAWQRLRNRRLDRGATRRFAETLGWAPVVAEQCALYARAFAASQQGPIAGATA